MMGNPINQMKALRQRVAQFGWQTGEEGQAIIVITLMMVGLIAMAGLIMDGGNAYAFRRRMQNAADAAAMAGTREMTVNVPGESAAQKEMRILATINKYAELNGVPDSTPPAHDANNTNVQAIFIDINGYSKGVVGFQNGVPSGATGIQVATRTTFGTLFLGVIGQNSGSAGAQARAEICGVNNLPNGILPIAPKCAVTNPQRLEDCGYQFDQATDIWDGGGPGNFGWLAWENTQGRGAIGSATMLEANLAHPETMLYTNPDNGNDHTVSIGDWVYGNSGISNGSDIRSELSNLVGQKVTLILWGQTTGTGSNLKYKVAGFAEFIILGGNLSGGNGTTFGTPGNCGTSKETRNCINGKFIKYVIGTPTDSTAPDLGLRSIHLRP